MNFYAAMDIGGSNARLQIANTNHQVIAECTGPGATINVVGSEKFAEIIAPLVNGTLKQHNLSAKNCVGLCVAASGVDQKPMEIECKQVFEKLNFPTSKIMVVNDCKVFLFQSTKPMAILTVGTGSVAFGRTYSGDIIRCGGWGQLLSDEGSGFYIGMKILQTIGNYLDHRCDAPILWELFQKDFPSLTTTLDINNYAVNSLTNKPAVAKLALYLEKAYLLNDPAAIEILETCVTLQFNILADLIKNMYVPNSEKITILFWGSVLTNSQIISKKLLEKVENQLPAKVKFPKITALQAALQAAFQL